MSRNIFFRLDASPDVGFGHLRRCAVLAAECAQAGTAPYLLIRRQNVDLGSIGWPANSVVMDLPWDASPENDARLTVAFCQHHALTTGVVDHYRINASYQETLNRAGLHWMQFGNSNHTHPLLSDWVHDSSPGATPTTYASRVDPCRPPCFLTGTKHALVGTSFRQERMQMRPPAPRPIETILLTFGGGNDREAALTVLDCLDAVRFTGRRLILTTSLNPHCPALQARASNDSRIELHINNWDPAPLMARCQLAISAAGTTLHELACLGVPAATVTIADNQIAPALAWQQAGLSWHLGDIGTLQESPPHLLLALLLDPVRCAEYALRCWLSQDGQGASRIRHALLAAPASP